MIDGPGELASGGSRLTPFTGGLVRPGLAGEVVSPPYDALTVAQRASTLDRRPRNYLGVLRRAEDTPGRDHLEASRQALDALLAANAFEWRPPAVYACRLTQHGHAQLGVVADVPVAWAEEGRILGHEQVRGDRADELLAHLQAVGVTSSPVVLAHRYDRALAELLGQATRHEPLRAFTLDDGLSVRVWALGADEGEAVRRRLDHRRLYVTDGHHRMEAARRHRLGREHEPGSHQHILGALFDEEQLQVEAFHRIVAGVDDDLLDRLVEAGALRPTEGPTAPHRQGTFAVAAAGRWYRLDVPAGPDELAPSILQRAVLSPLLGVADPTTDARLLTVPGTTDPWAVAERAAAVGGVAFLLHRVSVAQLMVTADQGRTLPPKSTYFVPKMRSGIFLRRG